MKKNVLALSIAAMIGGFAGTASADVLQGKGAAPGAGEGNAKANLQVAVGSEKMSAANAGDFALSEGGAGHILLVPYFTSQNKNMSVLHVVNTDTINGKALKVRFRGAANSDDILDFTVFLSPGDVWTGAVQANDQGSYFRTNDKSCTLPDIRGKDQQFVTARLNTTGWDATKIANNTKEGYVEILNLADIPSDSYYGKDKNAQSALYTTTKHVGGVAPCDATILEKTLNQAGNLSTEAQLAAFGFNTPTGGLTGDWYILNVDQTTTFSGAATAIKAVDAISRASARGNYVLFPQDNVAVGSGDGLTADPLLLSKYADKNNKINQGPLITPVNYDFPDLSTPYVLAPDSTGQNAAKQAFLLTKAVARSAASNQYATDSIIQAKTDWVFSMPTRRYSVGANYAATTTASDNYRAFNLGVNADGLVGTAPQSGLTVGVAAPTYSQLNYFNGSNTTVDKDGNICVTSASSTFYDREEQKTTSGAIISPGNVASVAFCGEVSVLSFKDAGNSVLGATVARSNIASGIYENGWGNINVSTKGSNIVGSIPLMGASFIKMTNSGGLANNFSGTYGITWPHRYGN